MEVRRLSLLGPALPPRRLIAAATVIGGLQISLARGTHEIDAHPFTPCVSGRGGRLRRRRGLRSGRPFIDRARGLQDPDLRLLHGLGVRAAGFKARVNELPSLRSIRSTQGVPEALASCHTAMIGGYVLEGHVPAEDVRKLLAERPEAVGLAVPAMPLGSPGMETPDGQREPYETLLILKGGGTRVFARHG